MPLPFESVREQLLRAGIAPRTARRYVTELREHLADLAARERAAGLNANQAVERAVVLMGRDTDLVKAMIDRGAPRSLAARAPWAVFAMLPLVLLLAAIGVTGVSMFHLLWPVRTLALSKMPEGYRALITIVSFATKDLIGVLLAAGCITVAVRQRLASGWLWAGVSLIALCSALLGFHVHVHSPGGGSTPLYSMVGIVYRHGRPSLSATFAIALLRATVLLAFSTAAYYSLRARLVASPVSTNS